MRHNKLTIQQKEKIENNILIFIIDDKLTLTEFVGRIRSITGSLLRRIRSYFIGGNMEA